MPSKPNILFLCSDQHQAFASGFAGHPDVQTPNLDRLAAEGIRFDRAYCQSPVCVASRGSMVTGRYPHAHGALLLQDPLPTDSHTVAHHFQEQGYQTAAIGKMHFVDESRRHGFEVRVNEASFAATRTAEQREAFSRDQGRGSHFRGAPSKLSEDHFFDTYVADQTVRFLKETRDAERPFCLWSSFFLPHTPLVPHKRYWDLYDPEKLTLPQRSENDLQDGFEGHLIRAEERGWYAQSEEDLRGALAGYYGNISQMDANLGRVLDALRDLGLEQETIIVYTSDHGEMAGAHRMWTKHVMFEESVRVPLILRLPDGRCRGTSTDAMVEHVDLFPTLAELSGLPAPDDIHGQSFEGILGGGAVRHRDVVFSEYHFCKKVFTADNRYVGKPPILMVRTERWKLCYLSWARCELYDLEKDPGEHHNLIDAPEHASTVKELKQLAQQRFEA